MAARAIASATISFGLVTVPVKLYTATQAKSVSFHLLHATDRSRVRQQYVCATCGEVVERGAMVKGYEYTKDRYVVLGDDELRALDKKTDQSIEIEEFVPIAAVDPVYFEKSHMLGPDKGGHKAYALLRAAMERTGKVAVGRFATRGRLQLVLLRAVAEGLMLHGLYHADEVRGFADVERGETVALKTGELDLATKLIAELAVAAFEPGKYEDEYRKSVLEVIERKAAGEEIVVAAAPPPRERIVDIMEALKASIAAKRGRAGVAPAPARRPARAKGGAPAARRSAAKRT